jgi:hypothetical protein
VYAHLHQRFVLLTCAIVGWALCAGVMGIGLSLTTLENTLIVHAVAAPLIFGALAAAYFRAYPDASVIRTAAAWVTLVTLLDLVVVAGVLLQSLAMFQSPLVTRIPFALIFLSTVSVGQVRVRCGGAGGHSPDSAHELHGIDAFGDFEI